MKVGKKYVEDQISLLLFRTFLEHFFKQVRHRQLSNFKTMDNSSKKEKGSGFALTFKKFYWMQFVYILWELNTVY